MLKYLYYAIGEILLVVLGILIALQVDTWNRENSQRKLELQYYQEMKSQLLADKAFLNNELDYNDGFLEQFQRGISIIDNDDRAQEQALARIVLELKNNSDFRRQSSIYQTLVNSGEIKYVGNREIIEHLQRLERNYTYSERVEEVQRQAVLQHAVSMIVNNIQIQPLRVQNPDVLFSYQMQNTLLLFIGLVNEKSSIYRQAISNIDTTIGLLDVELASAQVE